MTCLKFERLNCSVPRRAEFVPCTDPTATGQQCFASEGPAEVCRHPRWQLVDYDQMSMPFSLTGLHLRDGIHAGPAFLAQVLNIYLNLYKQHLIETGQKPLPPSGPYLGTSEPCRASRMQ